MENIKLFDSSADLLRGLFIITLISMLFGCYYNIRGGRKVVKMQQGEVNYQLPHGPSLSLITFTDARSWLMFPGNRHAMLLLCESKRCSLYDPAGTFLWQDKGGKYVKQISADEVERMFYWSLLNENNKQLSPKFSVVQQTVACNKDTIKKLNQLAALRRESLAGLCGRSVSGLLSRARECVNIPESFNPDSLRKDFSKIAGVKTATFDKPWFSHYIQRSGRS